MLHLQYRGLISSILGPHHMKCLVMTSSTANKRKQCQNSRSKEIDGTSLESPIVSRLCWVVMSLLMLSFHDLFMEGPVWLVVSPVMFQQDVWRLSWFSRVGPR